MRAAPGDALVGVELEEQVELRAVEQVVVARAEVEEREGDVRRAATGDRFDRPGAIAAAVASCWNTRIGSSVDSTVTVVPSRIRRVEEAAALTNAVGDDSGIERVWCSPKPKKSRPTSSARRTASSTFRIACAVAP